MIFNAIEVSDIQPQNVRSETGFSNDVKIRHSWVKQLPDDLAQQMKGQFRGAPEVAFDFYQGIDKEVSDKWIEMMKHKVEKNKSTMVKAQSGEYRLADHLCNQADEILILAAQEVILSMYQ